MLVAGCANVNMETYRIPDSIASYATIKDRPYSLGKTDTVQIISIERERVDRESRGLPKAVASSDNDLKNVIVLATGVRKLHVRACKLNELFFESYLGRLGMCASSVLRLEARPGFQYRVRAIVVTKKGDYADI